MTLQNYVQAAAILVLIAGAAMALAKVTDTLFAAIQKKFRQARALRRVVRAAGDWADAERELRNFNANRPYRRTQVFSPFTIVLGMTQEELVREKWEQHRIATACDFTENELLDAVAAAQADGLNLSR